MQHLDKDLKAYLAGDDVSRASRSGYAGRRQASKRARCLADAQMLANGARLLCGVTAEPGRSAPVVKVRRAIVWLLTRRGHSLLSIAAAELGISDHTTALHARRAVEASAELQALARMIERAGAGDFSHAADAAEEIVAPAPALSLDAVLRSAARQVGRQRCVVRCVRLRAGIGPARINRPKTCRIADQDRPKILALADKGRTFSEIAQRFGVTRSAVAGAVVRARKVEAGHVG